MSGIAKKLRRQYSAVNGPCNVRNGRSPARRVRSPAESRPRPTSTRSTGATTSCAMRMPRETRNASRPEVDQRDADLAAVVGIDRRRRVRQADAVLHRQARARPHLPFEAVRESPPRARSAPARSLPARSRHRPRPRRGGPCRRRPASCRRAARSPSDDGRRRICTVSALVTRECMLTADCSSRSRRFLRALRSFRSCWTSRLAARPSDPRRTPRDLRSPPTLVLRSRRRTWMRIGVPTNPNCSRSLLMRKRSYEK